MVGEAGLYRIAGNERGLLYVGETAALPARLRSHSHREWGVETPMVSVATLVPAPAQHELHELEGDLIAGYFDEVDAVPTFQFSGGRGALVSCRGAIRAEVMRQEPNRSLLTGGCLARRSRPAGPHRLHSCCSQRSRGLPSTVARPISPPNARQVLHQLQVR